MRQCASVRSGASSNLPAPLYVDVTGQRSVAHPVADVRLLSCAFAMTGWAAAGDFDRGLVLKGKCIAKQHHALHHIK